MEDFETVADELYTLLPSEFTATRDDRARTARREGDRELARHISALRKPTVAAWAANLLVRERPEETDRFLTLGEELRRAYRDLDGDQLRELARTQRQLVAALSRSARDAAAEAGQPIGDGAQRDVEQTLQAVLADPDAAEQWSAGHLSKPLTPPTGFSTTDLRVVPSEPGPSKRSKKAQPAKPAPRRKREDRDDKGEATELDKARERRRAREQEAEETRRAADEAAEEARSRTEDRDAADEDLAAAKDRRKAADDRLKAARQELGDAEREQQAAADAERETRDRAQDAARAAREADRTARRAADRAERLSSGRRSRR